MGAVQVTVKVDPASAVSALQDAGSPVMRAMARAGTATVGLARVDLVSAGIGDTGRLAQSLEAQTSVQGTVARTKVVAPARNEQGVPYGLFVHEGTQGPIRPRTMRTLRFRGRGGAFVFRREVRGTRETGNFTPFLTNALARLTAENFAG